MNFWTIIANIWPLVVLVLPFAVTLAVNLTKRLDAQLPATQRATLEQFVATAVTAVEQMFKNAIPTTQTGQVVINTQKKQTATQITNDLAAVAKQTLPKAEVVSALIEQAVARLPVTLASGLGGERQRLGAITQPFAALGAGTGPDAGAAISPSYAPNGDKNGGAGIPIPAVVLPEEQAPTGATAPDPPH